MYYIIVCYYSGWLSYICKVLTRCITYYIIVQKLLLYFPN